MFRLTLPLIAVLLMGACTMNTGPYVETDECQIWPLRACDDRKDEWKEGGQKAAPPEKPSEAPQKPSKPSRTQPTPKAPEAAPEAPESPTEGDTPGEGPYDDEGTDEGTDEGQEEADQRRGQNPGEGSNPGNDKPVGNSKFDGERGEEPSGKDKKKHGRHPKH